MDPLLKQVRQAQRRLALQQFSKVLPWCWFFALLLAGIAIVVHKFFPVIKDEPLWIAAWTGGSMVAGLIVAIAWTFWGKGDSLAAAIEVDRRFALKERVSTALALTPEELETPAGQAVLHDAMRRLDRLDVPDRFRIVVGRRALLPLIPALAAFALALFVDQRGQSNPAQATTASEVQQVKRSTQELQKRVMERREQAKALGLKDAEGLFKKIEEGTKDLTRSDLDRRKALMKLNDLTKELEKRREQLAGGERIKQQLNQLKDLKQGPAEKLAKALRNGDMQQAKNEIEKLRKQLKQGNLDEKAQKQLAEQLDQMSKTLDKLKKAHDQAKKDLEQEIERKEKAGQTEAADKLRQQLDSLKTQDKQLSKLGQMAKQLSKAGQQLQQGQAQKAEQELAEVSQDLAGLQETLEEMEMLDDAMAQMAEAKSSMNCRQCKGAGCKACQGGGDKNGRPGEGLGKGRGQGERPEKDNPTQSYDSTVRQKVTRGAAVATGLADGPNRKGEVQEQIKAEFEAAKRQAEDPLTEQKLPRHHREHAKKYFNALREGRK